MVTLTAAFFLRTETNSWETLKIINGGKIQFGPYLAREPEWLPYFRRQKIFQRRYELEKEKNIELDDENDDLITEVKKQEKELKKLELEMKSVEGWRDHYKARFQEVKQQFDDCYVENLDLTSELNDRVQKQLIEDEQLMKTEPCFNF